MSAGPGGELNERTEYLLDCVVLRESDVVDIIYNGLGEIADADVVVEAGLLIRNLDIVDYLSLW
jgi:hypothetical protein